MRKQKLDMVNDQSANILFALPPTLQCEPQFPHPLVHRRLRGERRRDWEKLSNGISCWIGCVYEKRKVTGQNKNKQKTTMIIVPIICTWQPSATPPWEKKGNRTKKTKKTRQWLLCQLFVLDSHLQRHQGSEIRLFLLLRSACKIPCTYNKSFWENE
jgi:hypothetical protein